MSVTLTAEHHAWVKDVSGGTVDPSKYSPVAAGPNVRVFAEKATTRAWMHLFDQFYAKNAKGVSIAGKEIGFHEFEQAYVWKVGQQVRHAIDVVWDLNSASLTEGGKLDADNIALVNRQVAASTGKLNEAKADLDGGHYEASYLAFLAGLNQAMQARETIGAFDKKVIDDANHMVVGLEVVRNSGFAALSVLAAPAGVSLVLVTAAGIGVTAADDWAEGKSLGEITFDVLLTLCFNKLGSAMEKPITSRIVPWLDKYVGTYFSKATSSAFYHKFGDWLLEKKETEALQAFTAMLAHQKLGAADFGRILDKGTKFIAEKHFAKAMVDTALEDIHFIIKKIAAPIYNKVISGDPNKSLKERCEEFVKDLEDWDWTLEKVGEEVLTTLFEKAATKL